MANEFNRRALMIAGAAGAMSANAAAADEDDITLTEVCEGYLDGWRRKDIDAIAAHLHPDLSFTGPMLQSEGKDAFLASSARIFAVLERFDLRAMFVSGGRVMFAYDFICAAPIGVCRTAELVRFDGPLIRAIELFYDARPFEAAQRAKG